RESCRRRLRTRTAPRHPRRAHALALRTCVAETPRAGDQGTVLAARARRLPRRRRHRRAVRPGPDQRHHADRPAHCQVQPAPRPDRVAAQAPAGEAPPPEGACLTYRSVRAAMTTVSSVSVSLEKRARRVTGAASAVIGSTLVLIAWGVFAFGAVY